MNTTLLVQITGNTWQQVDLFEEIPITLTIQQADLLDLTNRRAPYSRTFEVPDTANNAKVFEHYFDVNGIDFNPLNKIDCVVQYRGTDIFSGILRMNAVIEGANLRAYELFILGEVADWFSSFKDLNLQDLDFTDLNHDLEYSAVTTSWECVNDGASGLFNGQIIYPLINYGLRYSGETSGATPSFSMDFNQPYSFDSTSYPMAPSDFKPAIQIKSIVDRIFSISEDYTILSDFFDSRYFSAIYMDTFQNAEMGVLYASATTNQNIFKASFPYKSYQYSKDTLHNIPLFDGIGDSYDPLGNYFNVGGADPYGYFRAPYAGAYNFNFRFNLRFLNPIRRISLPQARIAVVAYVGNNINTIKTTGTLVYQSPDILLNDAFLQDLPVNVFFSANMSAGQVIQIFFLDLVSQVVLGTFSGDDYAIKPFSQGGVSDINFFWDLYDGPVLASPLVNMALGVPNFTCQEFIKSLITLFNLVILQDEIEKTIRIEPYNWFYNDEDREVKDWTEILDNNSPKRIEPLSYDLSKDIVWTYKSMEQEYLPKQFRERFDFEFGRKKFTSGAEVFYGEQEYAIPFSPCPSSGVTGNDDFIIPQYYYLNNQQQAPYSTKSHLFFWVGNRYVSSPNDNTPIFPSTPLSWYLLSGSTPIEWTTYPCVNHLSNLDSQLSTIVSDLNFDRTFDFFGNTNTYINQFTEYTLYDTFWKSYVENLYSLESRRLIGRFFFTPLDVYETKLNDKIWIKDAPYTIEKITDANLVNKGLTQISLVKEPQPYLKIVPPAPIYSLTPNEPYPSTEPTFIDGCFLSDDSDAVCNGTAPIINVLSFGTGTLQSFRKVYTDSGTAWVIIPMGTYIRQTSSSTTWVVSDTYGRILEYTC